MSNNRLEIDGPSSAKIESFGGKIDIFSYEDLELKTAKNARVRTNLRVASGCLIFHFLFSFPDYSFFGRYIFAALRVAGQLQGEEGRRIPSLLVQERKALCRVLRLRV